MPNEMDGCGCGRVLFSFVTAFEFVRGASRLDACAQLLPGGTVAVNIKRLASLFQFKVFFFELFKFKIEFQKKSSKLNC